MRARTVRSGEQLGSHAVSVRPVCNGSSTKSLTQSEGDGTTSVVHYEYTCGDTTVLIRGNTLSVNGKSYGTLNEGDWIAVDYGKVRVNSEVRAEVR
jgi:hypothetical protein